MYSFMILSHEGEVQGKLGSLGPVRYPLFSCNVKKIGETGDEATTPKPWKHLVYLIWIKRTLIEVGLTTTTVRPPGDGIKLVGINKHCQLTEGLQPE